MPETVKKNDLTYVASQDCPAKNADYTSYQSTFHTGLIIKKVGSSLIIEYVFKF